MRILIVDDEFVSLNKLSLLLSAYGECDAATNGGQALEMFKLAHEEKRPYDLITMDISMPGLSGLEVVSKIRGWEFELGIRSIAQEVKILMVTATTDSKSIISSFKKGCEGYLYKPFNKEKVHNALMSITS